MKFKLVLASASPRRKELIGHLGIPFTIIPSHEDEESEEADPVKYSQAIALLKAESVGRQMKAEEAIPVIVSADTIVVLKGKIFGKPKDRDEAKKMLQEMSGQTHDVYTSVVLLSEKKKKVFCIKTSVTFESIPTDILEKYLASGDSLDKAGAYGIQGEALSFISRIDGSYSNVVGFPLSHFMQELEQFLNLNLASNDWRKLFC